MTPNDSDGGSGDAHSREEAMLRELWDASREESPPLVPNSLRGQRSDSSLAEKIRFLAEASWTSEVDFMDLPGQNTTDLTNEIQNLQGPGCPGGNPGVQVPVTSGWPHIEQITPDNGGNVGLFPGNELDPFAGLPSSRISRENGSTTLPQIPPLFTSAAPCTGTSTSTGIPSKLFDFIAPHLPTDTDLSSLMNMDTFPDQTRGLAPHLGISSEAGGGVPNSSQLVGQAPMPTPGVLNGVPLPNNGMQGGVPMNQGQFSPQVQDPRMDIGMQRPAPLAIEHLIPPQYQMSVPGHNQTVTSQMTCFSPATSPSVCSEPVHTVSFDRRAPGNFVTGVENSYGHAQRMCSPLQQGSYGSQTQSGVWGSDTRRTLEQRTWSQSPTQTVGYLPSETYTGSWSPQSCVVQLEPSLVPSSQPRARSFSGPIPSTVISKSINRFPAQHSPSPEPQYHAPYRPHQVATVGTNVMDRLEVLDIESSMSSGSTGTSVSSGYRVHRGSKSLEDPDDGTVMFPKKVVRRNTEGEGCPVRQETSETPRKSVVSVNTDGDDPMSLDSEAPQNSISVEDYLTILRSAKGSRKSLQRLMPCRAPGAVDPTLEEAINKCDFDLRVSRAQKKMEEHNESMSRIDQMVASGQMSREEAKSRRRQAYNRREAAASRARKDNELRDIVREKERLEKVEKHLRELIISGPPPIKKKMPVLRRQNSAGACGSGQSNTFNLKPLVASKPADIIDLAT